MVTWLLFAVTCWSTCRLPVTVTNSPAPPSAQGTNWLMATGITTLVVVLVACASAARGRDSPASVSAAAKESASASLGVILSAGILLSVGGSVMGRAAGPASRPRRPPASGARRGVSWGGNPARRPGAVWKSERAHTPLPPAGQRFPPARRPEERRVGQE